MRVLLYKIPHKKGQLNNSSNMNSSTQVTSTHLYRSKQTPYPCDVVLGEGFLKETEVVLAVILSLCIELHLAHVYGTRDDAIHDLAVTSAWKINGIQMAAMWVHHESVFGKAAILICWNEYEPEEMCCSSWNLVFRRVLSHVSEFNSSVSSGIESGLTITCLLILLIVRKGKDDN